MAIKYLTIVLFFALVVIKPVHDSYPDEAHRNSTKPDPKPSFVNQIGLLGEDSYYEADYLWMYLVFAYFFTGLALYLIITESRRIIEIRQNYLGSQSTVTDRTLRLSGIPKELQLESNIKNFLEELEIGKVESVLLVKDWDELDTLMEKRNGVLRKLERAMVEHDHCLREERSLEALPTANPNADDDREDSHLLDDSVAYSSNPRPQERVWFGLFNLQHRYVDAIDYYEEKLRKLDEEIVQLRKGVFETMPLAFVTMDSVAACQMAVQAVLDSSPLQLIATTSPAPVDVDWPNTYMPRRHYLIRYWSITALIFVLTILWSIILVPIAGLISLDRIKTISPQLAKFLNDHPLGKSLVQTQGPTLIISGLNVVVPYFYSCRLSNYDFTSDTNIRRVVISTRRDISWRCRTLCDFQELLLHIL
jgi:calcium permeable stress-gated cation channel